VSGGTVRRGRGTQMRAWTSTGHYWSMFCLHYSCIVLACAQHWWAWTT